MIQFIYEVFRAIDAWIVAVYEMKFTLISYKLSFETFAIVFVVQKENKKL